MGIGQSWFICIGNSSQLEQLSHEVLSVDVSYSDNMQQYNENTTIDLSQYYWALQYGSPDEDLNQTIKGMGKDIHSISELLKKNK